MVNELNNSCTETPQTLIEWSPVTVPGLYMHGSLPLAAAPAIIGGFCLAILSDFIINKLWFFLHIGFLQPLNNPYKTADHAERHIHQPAW